MISPALSALDLISSSSASARDGTSKYNEDDELIFSKDDEPEMYRALGIRRLRDRRDYSRYDSDKIVRYLLDRDTALIRGKTGGFRRINDDFIRSKRYGVTYKNIDEISLGVKNGDFAEVSRQASDVSWRATTVPNGPRSVPISYNGISAEEIRIHGIESFADEEIAKRARDYFNQKLWDDLKSGRIPVDDAVPAKNADAMSESDLSRLEYERERELEENNLDPVTGVQIFTEKQRLKNFSMSDPKGYNISVGRFDLNRIKLKEEDKVRSKCNWSRGIHLDNKNATECSFPECELQGNQDTGLSRSSALTGVQSAESTESIQNVARGDYDKTATYCKKVTVKAKTIVVPATSSLPFIKEKKRGDLSIQYVHFRERAVIVQARKYIADKHEQSQLQVVEVDEKAKGRRWRKMDAEKEERRHAIAQLNLNSASVKSILDNVGKESAEMIRETKVKKKKRQIKGSKTIFKEKNENDGDEECTNDKSRTGDINTRNRNERSSDYNGNRSNSDNRVIPFHRIDNNNNDNNNDNNDIDNSNDNNHTHDSSNHDSNSTVSEANKKRKRRNSRRLKNSENVRELDTTNKNNDVTLLVDLSDIPSLRLDEEMQGKQGEGVLFPLANIGRKMSSIAGPLFSSKSKHRAKSVHSTWNNARATTSPMKSECGGYEGNKRSVRMSLEERYSVYKSTWSRAVERYSWNRFRVSGCGPIDGNDNNNDNNNDSHNNDNNVGKDERRTEYRVDENDENDDSNTIIDRRCPHASNKMNHSVEDPDKAEIEKIEENVLKIEEGGGDEVFLDALYDSRERERQQEQILSRIYDKIIGVPHEEDHNFSADHLITASLRGNYRLVIDIVSEKFATAGPNDEDKHGTCATYATLLSVLTKGTTDIKSLSSDADSRLARMLALLGRGKNRSDSRVDWVVKILLDRGGDLDFVWKEVGEDGLTLMHRAASINNVDFIEWLLKKGASGVRCSHREKMTPLMFASGGGHVKAVLTLLDTGLAIKGINTVDLTGRTALHHCALGGNAYVAQVLLLCGADSSIRSLGGLLATDEARTRGHSAVAAIISAYSDMTLERTLKMMFMSEVYPSEIQ